MKARGAAIQGALAAVGLLAAYAAWQREPEVGAEEVVILDPSKSDLERIRFEDGPRLAVLERRREGGEDGLWLHTAQKAPPAPAAADGGAAGDGGTPAQAADGGVASGKPDAGTAVAATPPVEPPKPDRDVKTNEQADKLFERFTPLRASRALGALPPEKLKELGLEGSPRQLEVVARGKATAFTLSTAGGAPYLRNTQDGKVYLVSSMLISDLESASTRLVDRRLHAFRQNEPDTVAIKFDDKRRELAQTTNEQGVVTRVASKATPDKPDDFAKNWLERVWRLIPTDVLGKGELPPGGAPPEVLTLEYFQKGRSLGALKMGRVGTALYVRSEHTASWVKVHAPADEILSEAGKVVSGQ